MTSPNWAVAGPVLVSFGFGAATTRTTAVSVLGRPSPLAAIALIRTVCGPGGVK
jgi:hypothetical protein